MAWDLATAKELLGIDPGDTSQDVAITKVMGVTLATIEKLLQRGIIQLSETQIFHWLTSRRVLLRRYPLVEITALDGGSAAPADVTLNLQTGWAEHSSWCGLESLSITYTGGFDPIPDDLERAMWEAFSYLYSKSDTTTGLAASTAAGASEISGVTVFDAFKIDYSVDSSGAESAAAQREAWGWLAPWATVLNMYRSEQGVGLGLA